MIRAEGFVNSPLGRGRGGLAGAGFGAGASVGADGCAVGVGLGVVVAWVTGAIAGVSPGATFWYFSGLIKASTTYQIFS